MNARIWSRYWRAEASVPLSAWSSRAASSSRAATACSRPRAVSVTTSCGAELEAANEVVLGERLAHHEDRHVRGEACALLHRAAEFVRVGDAEEQQLRRIGRAERVGEVGEVPHPGAVHGLAGVAQGAVDDLDGVLLPGQDDHWNGAGFAQLPTPSGADPAGRAAARV